MTSDPGAGSGRLFRDRNLHIIFSITLIAVLAVSSITPAFPQISRELGVSPARIGWLISAFTVPGVFLTPVLGVAADRWGRKQVLVPSLLLFAVAGTACAFATDFQTLLGLRLLQGVRTRARADLDRRAQLELDAAKEEGAGEKRIKELKAERRRASIELSMKSLDLQEWLLDNMSSEPQVSVVAEYVKIIARAERVEFLRKNPEADANGDGILSAEEQQAYNQSRWARRLAEIRDEIEQVLARLEDPDLRPGQIRELEGRLKRLRANEAEYAGAMKTRRGRP